MLTPRWENRPYPDWKVEYPKKREPRLPKLYTTKRTPGGSVVVFGDHVISEYEMPEHLAQQLADWHNGRKNVV